MNVCTFWSVVETQCSNGKKIKISNIEFHATNKKQAHIDSATINDPNAETKLISIKLPK